MKRSLSIIAFALVLSLSACGHKKATIAELQTRVDSMQSALDTLSAQKMRAKTQLKDFATHDMIYFNKQWDQLANTYDQGVRVFYPDGMFNITLANHTEMSKRMFSFTKDATITQIPVRFGNGEWTAVVSEVQGKFTDTLQTSFGKLIPPDSNSFKFLKCTISHWVNGKVSDEYWFWDNYSLYKQLGILNKVE